MGKRNSCCLKILFTVFMLASLFVKAQVFSPFNGLKVNDSVSNYSFLVSGHFHGQSNNSSTFPAATVLASIDTLNIIHPTFLMSLGDLFLDVNDVYIDHYNSSLFSKIKFPLFNSVGNHDISNGNRYEKEFGETYFSFIIGSELFIVLNTEMNDGSIKTEQLKFLKSILDNSKKLGVRNIFIFTHRPIWAEQIGKYKNLFLDNTRTAFGENNFIEELVPLLKQHTESKNVFWISGSMGGGPSSFFYDKNDEYKMTFIQTAIRDLPRDAVLQIDVKDGTVSLKGISLTGQSLQPVETYNLDYWKQRIDVEEPFNYRLLPLLTMQMLQHYYFWIGFASSILLLLIFSFLYNRWKKRG